MVAVPREDGCVLAVRRTDNGYWSLPGGFLHLGENAAHCAQREVEEETGIQVEIERLVGVSAPTQSWVYPNGDQTIAVVAHFIGRPLTGELHPDGEEISHTAWLPPADILAQPYHPILTPTHSAILRAMDETSASFII
jgi:ADP-ribose pyrophosphatase YjhB (NUDIX family)